MIGLIDVEGFVLARGGSNRHKLTTLVPFAVAALLVRPDGSVERSQTWSVCPRGFDPAAHPADRMTAAVALAKCKNRGLYQRAEASGRVDVEQVVREVRDFLRNGEIPVYARGISIETRFLSGRGLCGEVIESRTATPPFPVHDLAEPRDPSGQPVCPPFSGTVHDPLAELQFFAPYAVRVHLFS